MTGRSLLLYNAFTANLGLEPTACQDKTFRHIARFVTGDDSDILVLSGFAGTGKTTLVAAVVNTLMAFGTNCVLLAPTGRAAKVLSNYSGRKAYTIHKHIYRQKAVDEAGMGLFSLSYNKASRSLFVVDEASLIGAAQTTEKSIFGSGDLLADLISFVRNGAGCKLLLVGDKAQIPPVGLEDSPALADSMAAFGGVEFESMTTVVRQQAGSLILDNATRLRHLLFGDDGFLRSSFAASDLKLVASGAPDVQRITGTDLLEILSDAYARYGEAETMVLCRSNKMANRYNAGIRAKIQFKEENLLRGDRLLVVKNCYQIAEDLEEVDFIANGDVADLIKISKYEERYGLHFAEARLSFPDYGDQEVVTKVCMDTLTAESPALDADKQNALYQGVSEDYAHIKAKKKRYSAIREDPYYNALQIKYAYALTCHKAQGGQWKCVFIDNPLWGDEYSSDQLRWLYTAITRATEKVYLVNFSDKCFK